ncbi:MAG: hypothetical protein GC162_14285 [Planctomycetes bacterium]|nr:hypothetical protein [Planctomycetota bacterium]
MMRRLSVVLLFAVLAGCQKEQQVKPDYNKPLPPGANALRLLLDPAQWPDLKEPWERKDPAFMESLDRSRSWFGIASTKQFFPLFDVSHLRAQMSVYALSKILTESQSGSQFEQRMREDFDCYTSVGYDNKGGVLFTGYYTPVFKASKTADSTYKYPLYKKPADLDIEPMTGKVLGRKVGSGYQPFPTRSEIESSNMLKGTELVYVKDRLDQYIIQVNGSAKLELADGSVMYIGYSGNNGHDYTGLGQTLVKEGKISPEHLSLPAIRAYFADKPAELERYINMNDRYVFFAEYNGQNWPAGSLGFKATPMTTLATDKSVFPRGGLVVVQTKTTPMAGPQGSFNRMMLDQDTGGAIRAAGRADIYMGIGPDAEQRAGGQFAEGRMYYFFLKHGKVLEWHQKMLTENPPASVKPGKSPKPNAPASAPAPGSTPAPGNAPAPTGGKIDPFGTGS